MLGLLVFSAFIGNLFPFLFLGHFWTFGSIAVLLIVFRFGLRWGLVAVLAGNLYALALWLPPILPALAIAEAIVIGICPRREPVKSFV